MRSMIVAALAAVGGLVSVVSAGSYSLSPTPRDMYDLEHGKAYTWGVNTPWSAKESLVSATLTFKNIRDWTVEPNTLYIHLLDNPALGVKTLTDYQGNGDYFASQGISLKTYSNLPTKAQTLTYSFTAQQLASLGSYAADGRFGLGLDPDCHFYNDGVSLNVQTCAVPLPSAAMMFIPAAAIAGWVSRRMKRTA